MTVQHVLVGVDDSPASDTAPAWALDVLRRSRPDASADPALACCIFAGPRLTRPPKYPAGTPRPHPTPI